MIKSLFSLLIVTACLAPNTGWSLIGDPVPPLVVKEWVQGTPVEINPGTNIFVVEMLTVSGASGRAVLTDFDRIQKRFKTNGVVFAAVSAEPAAQIQANLRLIAETLTNMEFSIGADNQRQTTVSYLDPAQPAGRRVMPYAFVVNTNGNLLWHGLPQRGLAAILDLVVAGRFDEAMAKKIEVAERQMFQYLQAARQGGDRVEPAGRALLAARTNDAPLLCDLAYEIATAPRLATRDFELANAALDRAEKLAPTNMTPVLLGRAIVLYESGQHEAGLTEATQALASAQSPLERTNILTCIQTMKTRLAKSKSPSGDAGKSEAAPGPAAASDASAEPGFGTGAAHQP